MGGVMRSIMLAVSLCIASMGWAQSGKEGGKPKPPANDPCGGSCCYQNCPPLPPITVNVSPTQTLNAGPADHKKDEHKETKWDMLIGIGTVGLAIFTAVLAWVGIKQRGDTKDSSQKALRAYIAVDGFYFPIEEHPMQLGGSLRSLAKKLHVRVKNYGQTPSFETSVWFQADDKKPEDDLNVDAAGSGKQMLHPSMQYSMANPEPGSLGPYGQDGWVWGQIVYRDIFSRWWRTNFLYRYQPPYEGKGVGTFTPEKEHNEEKGPYESEEDALAGG